ncbi:MAG: CopD family protein [Pseudomonadota bacterium]
MAELLLPYYLWIKALHIIFVVALMAGLLMAPRLRIYQLASKPGEPLFDTMSDASRRLRMIIMNPALIITWVLGLLMLWVNPVLLEQGWFHGKLVLVIILSGIHGWIISIGKKVDRADGTLSEKQLRLLNEVPFMLMIGVVLLAVPKPF